MHKVPSTTPYLVLAITALDYLLYFQYTPVRLNALKWQGMQGAFVGARTLNLGRREHCVSVTPPPCVHPSYPTLPNVHSAQLRSQRPWFFFGVLTLL